MGEGKKFMNNKLLLKWERGYNRSLFYVHFEFLKAHVFYFQKIVYSFSWFVDIVTA